MLAREVEVDRQRLVQHQAVVVQHQQAQVAAGDHALAAVENLVEHRSGVGHRAADDLQHLGAGRLPFQRFLRFIEEPGIFDGDAQLPRNGDDKRKVALGEWLNVLLGAKYDTADDLLLGKQGNAYGMAANVNFDGIGQISG